MHRSIIKILFLLILLFQIGFSDMLDFKSNIGKLQHLNMEKDRLKKELLQIDQQLEKLQKPDNSWLEKRKITKLTTQKLVYNNEIFDLIKKMSGLKKTCQQEFQQIYTVNESSINNLLDQFEKDYQPENLQKLLELKSLRDYLINSQKYFSSIDNKSFGLKQNFEIFNFSDPLVVQDFIALLNKKIHNVETAKSSAKKEIKIREKLENFRNEISTIHEPETFTQTTITSSTEGTNNWDNVYTDNDDKNYDNSRNGTSDQIETFEEFTSESDFLLLFEENDEQTIENFIQKMDSLKSYYSELIQELSKGQ